MSSTYTINLGLRKPLHRDPETLESWDQVINNNMDLIDAASLIQNRSVILFPEFPGASLTLSGSNNVGELTSDVDDATYRFNHYKWLSSSVTLQSYDISVQWQVPVTFLNWQADALQIDICTQLADITNCKVDVTICKDGVLGTTSDKVDKISTVGTTWYSARGSNALIVFTSADGVISSLVAEDILNIKIRMYSKSSNYVKIGNITLNYKG